MRLNYYMIHDNNGISGAFYFSPPANAEVSDLSLMFCEHEKTTLNDRRVPRDTLTFYVPANLNNLPEGDLHARATANLADKTPLDIDDRLASVWPWNEEPDEGLIHLVVVLPPTRESSIGLPVPKANRQTNLALLLPREEKVAGIWRKLMKYTLIIVRGPPGSGKTTLAELIQDYAEEVSPGAIVVPVHGWPKENRQDDWEQIDQLRYSPGLKIFIFDDAQMTYGDNNLWLGMFKNIRNYRDIYAILFASYGSPLPFIDFGYASFMFVQPTQSITLQAIDHQDGCPAVGLAFNNEEYSCLIRRKYKDQGGHHFDEGFLDEVLAATAGHIGTIHDVLSIIEDGKDHSQLKLSGSNSRYNIDDFKREFPPEALIQHFTKSSAFLRKGLPQDEDLQNIDVSRALSVVAQNTIVTTTEVRRDVQYALEFCNQRGWLHNDAIYISEVAVDSEPIVGYSFPSSFHQWYVQWKLFTQNEPEEPLATRSLLQFVLDVLRLFNPQFLSSRKHKMGPAFMERPGHMEFLSEFYRCSHVLCAGSLVSFSEFGMASPNMKKRKADFYVPSKKWGIELICDGDAREFEDHSGRFSRPQALYSSSEPPADDYIILDCRTSKPRDEYPNLNKLFRVVFQEDFHKVILLDNKNQPVEGGEIVLAGGTKALEPRLTRRH